MVPSSSVHIAALASALALVGCMAPAAPVAPAAVVSPAARLVDVTVAPHFGDRHTLDTGNALTRDDVARVELQLFKVEPGTDVNDPFAVTEVSQGATVSLAEAAIDNGYTFRRLDANARYRVRARAFRPTLPSGEETLSDEARSFVDIVLGTDDRPTMQRLKVVLRPMAPLSAGFHLREIAGDPLKEPRGIAFHAGKLFVAEAGAHSILKVDLATTVPSLFAGVRNLLGGVLNLVLAPEAEFNRPEGVAVDRDGNLYVTDSANGAVRRVRASDQRVETLATGLGRPRGIAVVHNPLDVHPQPYVYVADDTRHVIWRIDMASPVAGGFTTVAHAGVQYFAGTEDGEGAEAYFNAPYGVAAAPDGSVYVRDTASGLRRVTRDRLVTTVIPRTTWDFTDGTELGASILADGPLAVGPDGVVHFFDGATLRKYSPRTGRVSTVTPFQAGTRWSWEPIAIGGMTVAPDGTLYATGPDADDHAIFRLR